MSELTRQPRSQRDTRQYHRDILGCVRPAAEEAAIGCSKCFPRKRAVSLSRLARAALRWMATKEHLRWVALYG